MDVHSAIIMAFSWKKPSQTHTTIHRKKGRKKNQRRRHSGQGFRTLFQQLPSESESKKKLRGTKAGLTDYSHTRLASRRLGVIGIKMTAIGRLRMKAEREEEKRKNY